MRSAPRPLSHGNNFRARPLIVRGRALFFLTGTTGFSARRVRTMGFPARREVGTRSARVHGCHWRAASAK
jgi:hypothetical protein